jgi:preprotein translocase subunit SecG
MENIVLTVHLILALLLIGVVLLQRSEGGGLGMGSGGGGGAISGRAAATALGKITWVLAACFIATSITLTIMAANRAGSDSVANQLGIDAPASTTTTDAPAVKPEDLLPPVPADAPATPAKVED